MASRSTVRGMVLVVLLAGSAARAEGENAPPPPSVRVLLPGMNGNAPEKARTTAVEALHAAVTSTLPRGTGVYRCTDMAGAVMGLGLDENACASGKLGLDDAFQLDITHLLTGELMRVGTTYYATLNLRVRGKDTVEGTSSGNASTPDGAARDAWSGLKPDVVRVFKLAPPAVVAAPKPRKPSAAHLYVVTLRTGGVGRFTVQPPVSAQPMARWAAGHPGGTWRAVEMAAIPEVERVALEEDGLARPEAARRLLGDGKGPEDARLALVRIVASRAESVVSPDMQQRTHVVVRAVVMDPAGKELSSVDQEADVGCTMEVGAALPCSNSIFAREVPSALDAAWHAATAPTDTP